MIAPRGEVDKALIPNRAGCARACHGPHRTAPRWPQARPPPESRYTALFAGFPMLFLAGLTGCLLDRTAYDLRRDELTDHDGDGFAQIDDCDDDDAEVFDGAEEVCDEVDQDCDGAIDEDAVDAPAWYPDDDADTYGDADHEGIVVCDAPAGHVANALDCDDAASGVNPGAEETPYDDVDNDCEGGDLVDVDGDGEAAEVVGGGDCDDGDAGVGSGGVEVPYDGIDQDCDGADAEDLDGDGAVAVEAGGEDCEDLDPEIYPGAEETWANGVTDNDCDGEIEAAQLEYGGEVWVGESPGGQAGRRIGALGDVTGDGLADYLVGAVYESSLYENGGAIYLVEGGAPAGDLSDAHAVRASGSWALPAVIEGGPDIDGDGVQDFLATTVNYEDGAGAAFLLSGAVVASTLQITLADAAFGAVAGEAPGDYAGTGAAFLGDVMGDGGQYVAIGALLSDTSELRDTGSLALFVAEDIDTLRMSDGDVVVTGPYADAAFGGGVAPAGDVNGDGVGDYVVGVGSGDLASVIPGGLSNPELPGDAIFRLTGTGAGETGAVEMLGDVDGDGFRDLACIFEDNEVRVFLNLAADPSRTVEEESSTITLGVGALTYDVLDLGDLDGDGSADTYLPVQWYPNLATSFGAVIFGSDIAFRGTFDVSEAELSTVSLRTEARFGYRAAISEDVDGDGGRDIILGGYSDLEGGLDAGAVLTIPVPR